MRGSLFVESGIVRHSLVELASGRHYTLTVSYESTELGTPETALTQKQRTHMSTVKMRGKVDNVQYRLHTMRSRQVAPQFVHTR